MDYINPIQQHKRQRDEEHSQWEYHSQTKRVCLDLVRFTQVKCDVLTDSPVDPWDTLQISNRNGTSTNNHTRVVNTIQQCCPRCMAGESGHINHIMQRYWSRGHTGSWRGWIRKQTARRAGSEGAACALASSYHNTSDALFITSSIRLFREFQHLNSCWCNARAGDSHLILMIALIANSAKIVLISILLLLLQCSTQGI